MKDWDQVKDLIDGFFALLIVIGSFALGVLSFLTVLFISLVMLPWRS